MSVAPVLLILALLAPGMHLEGDVLSKEKKSPSSGNDKLPTDFVKKNEKETDQDTPEYIFEDGIDPDVNLAYVTVDCRTELLPGQYKCFHPIIDPSTQQPEGCNRETGMAPESLPCQALPGFNCSETQSANFTMEVACKWTNGYHFDTALLLSIFLGCFGADRFYLGYPALGLLKFSTLGFFFLGHLVDIILIASQVVLPADGSFYVMDYYGPGLEILRMNGETARRPMSDWYE